MLRRGARSARLDSIAVAESARGGSIGRRLLRRCEREARGAERMVLEVRSDNMRRWRSTGRWVTSHSLFAASTTRKTRMRSACAKRSRRGPPAPGADVRRGCRDESWQERARAARGAIHSWLREKGEVKIVAETSPEAIKARFGITPQRFWHTIEALRREPSSCSRAAASASSSRTSAGERKRTAAILARTSELHARSYDRPFAAPRHEPKRNPLL